MQFALEKAECDSEVKIQQMFEWRDADNCIMKSTFVYIVSS